MAGRVAQILPGWVGVPGPNARTAHAVSLAESPNTCGQGEIITGLHVETSVGRVALCAEAIAIGSALSDGAAEIVAVAAVNYPERGQGRLEPHVISPCGMCRELIADYAPGAAVAMADGRWLRASDLLPGRS